MIVPPSFKILNSQRACGKMFQKVRWSQGTHCHRCQSIVVRHVFAPSTTRQELFLPIVTHQQTSEHKASYFYVNPLADRGRHRRQPYFECACCPPNIARLLPMIPSFLYALSDDGVFVNLYAESEADLTVNGVLVRLRQRTDYPWDGEVTLQIGLAQPTTFALHLRIPSWCERASVTVNGLEKREGLGGEFVTLKREWRDGDTVKLSLPMSPEFVACHPFVEANGGRVAIRRGPIVYCLEQVDNHDADVWFIAAKMDSDLTPIPMQIGNLPIVAVQSGGFAVEPSAWDRKLYQPLRKLATKPVRFTAIPYFAWANRDVGPMTVWVAKG